MIPQWNTITYYKCLNFMPQIRRQTPQQGEISNFFQDILYEYVYVISTVCVDVLLFHHCLQ